MPDKISFIKTENLNEDLYNFMDNKYKKIDVSFVLEKKGENRSDRNDKNNYYSVDIKNKILNKERYLVDILGKLDLYTLRK